jgi:hypothetical protein
MLRLPVGNTIIIELIEAKKKKGIEIITNQKVDPYLISKMYEDHPFKGKVLMVGPEESFIKVDDMVYLKDMHRLMFDMLIDGKVRFAITRGDVSILEREQ